MPDFGQADDSVLLTAWKSGDASASGELVRRHYRSIYLFFFSKVGPDAAQDLTQAVFERLLEKPQDFREDATVRTYLFGIARWTLVHHHRKHRMLAETFDPSLDPLEIPEDVISMTSALAARREEVLFVRGMRELALDDQLVLELKYYDSMTVRELAAVFETPRATMADRVTRARTRLAEAVGRLEDSAKIVESTMAGLDKHMKALRAEFAARVKSR
ncbi:MAG: sigma-70 family RNA polymerase sigma factor [Nannocystaceae bacterium]|nr:sigma-70 family RNA polymerase sigma factor [Nannocystaceae bacterium]